MKKQTRLSVLVTLLALALLYGATPAALADSTGESEGTATVGNPAPTVTYVGLFNSAEDTDANNTNLIVWTEYRLNCTVGDTNQLTDLDNITFTIWEDTYADIGDSDHNVNHYSFEYDEDGDTWNELGPDSATDSHLVLGSCTDPADHSATSGEFKLAWKLHKTGNYTATKTWVANVTAFDSDNNAGNNQSIIFGVGFYTEVTVTDTTHGWSSLNPGDTDQQMDTPDADIDVTVTANAKYDIQAQSNSSVLQTAPAGNTFNIGNVTIHATTLGSSIPLTTSYTDIGALTGLGDLANGAEDEARAFTLWIDVPSGQPSGDYKYTLELQVIQA